MIRATDLAGRAVIDRDAAEKLGRIDQVIVDPDQRRVAGFVVAQGASLINTGTHTTLPASAVYAVGPDAVTVRRTTATADDAERLKALPRASDIVGRKVVSDDGRFLGIVTDVLIDPENGRVTGYALGDQNVMGKLENLLSGKKEEQPAYLRADTDLRAGRDLIVAPPHAVTRESELGGVPTQPPADCQSQSRWGDAIPAAGTPRSR